MNAQQTFIIEAGRRNSLEYKSGTGVSNSKWTNVINPILLKRGDYVSVDTAIINQKGAEASNNIEISGQESYPGSNIQQNFSLLEFGFYLNRTGINDVGLPYRFVNEENGKTHTEYNTTKYNTNDNGDITSINNKYGMPIYSQFLRKKGSGTSSTNVSFLTRVKSHNPYLFLDSKRYAKVNPNYYWARNDINPTSNKSGLFTETVPIFIDKGFQNASEIGEKITQQLQFSNDPNNQVEDLYIPKIQYYKTDSELEGINNPVITQQVFSGKLNKVFQANNQPITGNYSNENSLLGHLYCDNPNKFEWGSRLLTETELVDLTNNDRIRNQGTPNPFNYKDVISFDYPVLLWSTYTGSLEKSADNQERNQINAFYDFYSPSYSFLDTTEDGTNGFYLKNFTGNMSSYNDWYIQTKLSTSTDPLIKVAVYLSDPNQFFLWTMPQNPTNGSTTYKPYFFLDSDDLNNDQMIIYNMFDNWDGNWLADRENLVDWDWNAITRTNNTQPIFFEFNPPKDFCFTIQYISEGVSGSEYIFNFLTDPSLKDGEKYEISFNTTLKSSGNGNYNTTYLWVGGVNVMTINSDGNHTYSWTQSGDYNGSQAVMIQHYKDKNNGNEIDFEDFLVLGTSVNTGDEYIIKNILENYTNASDKVKMYSLTIEDVNIKNHKLIIEDNTIYPSINGNQFTVIGTGFRIYETSGSIYATNTPNSASYSNPVIMMYDDGTNQYIIGNLQGYKLWRLYRLTTRNPNDDIVNNLKIGDFDSLINLKNPRRTGQQYYNFSAGNDWDETTAFIDFEIGNIWNTINGGGGNPYTCSNEIYEGLQRSYTWYNFSDGNDYTGGTPSYTYSFVDGEGQTGSFHYNSILTIDTNGGNPASYTIYLQTQDNEGLSGIFLFNGSGAGNSWTLTTSGGQNGYGTLTLSGSVNLTIYPSSALTTNIINFDYDYHFNGFHDIYVKTDTTGDHKNGTYLLTLNAETQISQSGSGTWSYDDTTGQISFTANDTNNNFTLYYQTTNPGNTKAVVSFSIIEYVSINPPTIPNSSKNYYYSFTRNGDTYYMTLEGDEGYLTGEQGAVYINDTTIFGDWDFDTTTNNISFQVNNETFILKKIGVSINYLLSILYETNEVINVGGVDYDYPTNISNIGITSYGYTDIIEEKHFPIPVDYLPTNVNTVYLSYDFYNNFSFSSPTNGLVYQTTGENDPTNAVAEWKYEETSTKAFLTIYEIGDETEIYLKIDKDLSTILKKGWILTKTEKYAESRELVGSGTGNYLGITEKFYYEKLWENTGGGDFQQIPSSNTYPDFKDYTINNQDISASFVENSGLNNTFANLEQHEFLLTNMKMSLTNLKLLKGFMKDNEIYDGDLTGRNDIMKDDENFYCHFDIGRTDESKLDYDNNTHSNIEDYNATYPLFQEYMRDHGKITKDDGDNSNKNTGCICPRMKGKTEEEQRFKVYTRYNENWSSILKYDRRLTDFRGENGVNPYIPTFLYGAVATEEEFKTEKPDEYAFIKENNIAVYPYWIKKYSAIGFDYELAIGLDLYADSNNTNGRYFKVQDLTYFGFSPSLLDHGYIIGMNPDVPSLPAGAEPINYNWSNFEDDNCNFINVGSPQISIDYDPDKNKFIWNYLYNPIRFNSKNGVDADLEQEVCFLNDTQNARFYDNIKRDNQYTEDGSVDISGQQNLGILDSQCGVFLKDIYGESPRENGFITDKNDGILITNLNYENCLWWKMGFSYFDLKPIKFSENSFNNRFNGLTYNNTYNEYRGFGVSPFTNNSNLTIEDTGKINIFGANRTDPNDEGQAPGTPTPYIEPVALYGQPAFYLGFNNNQPVSIKVSSNPMISRSVITNIASSFLRIMTNIPLDTLSYNTNGSLSCAGYMTKNYLSSSFVYSFSTGFGGYLTRDMYLTSIETSLRNDVGLLVDNIDEFSTIFYKVVRNITLSNPSGGGDTETKENELLEDIKDELEENNETLEDIKDGEGVPVDVKDERGGQGNSQRISRGKLLKAVNKLGKSLPQGSKAESVLNTFRQSIIKDLPKFITKNISFISSYLSKYKGEEDEVDFLLKKVKEELTKLKDPKNMAEPDIYINLNNFLSSLNSYLVEGEAGNPKQLGEILMNIKKQFIFMNDDDEVQEQIRQLEENQQLISIKPKMREDFNDIYTDDIDRERIGEIGESLLQYDPASFDEFRKRVNDKSISEEDLKDTLNKYINGIGFVNELREPSPNETLSKEEKDKIKFNIRATQFVAQNIYLSIQSILRNSGGSVLRAVRNLNKGDFVSTKVFEKMTDAILSFVKEKQKSTKEFIENMADKYAGVSFDKFKKSPEATEFIREFTKTGAGTRGFLINSEGDLVKRTAGNKKQSVKLGEEFLKGRGVRFTELREDYLNKIVDEITTMAIDEDTTPKSFNIDVRNILTPLVDKSKTDFKKEIKDIEKRRRGRPKGTTKAVMEERRRKEQEQKEGGAGKDDEETKPERPQEPEEKTAEEDTFETKKGKKIKLKKGLTPRFKSKVLTKQERVGAMVEGRLQELEEEKTADKKGGGKPAQQEK